MAIRIEQRFGLAAIVPAFELECRECLPAIDHHLQRIGELILVLRPNIFGNEIFKTFLEQLGISEEVESSDHEVCLRMLWLFDELGRNALIIGLHDTKAAWIFNPEDTERRLVLAKDAIQIGIEYSIAKHDEHGSSVGRYVLSRNINGVAKTFQLSLFNEGGLKIWIGFADERLDGFAHIAYDDRCTRNTGCNNPIEDMGQNGPTSNIQQNFGKAIRVWPKPRAEAGNGNDRVHVRQKYDSICRMKADSGIRIPTSAVICSM